MNTAACLLVGFSAALISLRVTAAEDAGEALFVRRIEPLLQEKCVACHGADAEAIEGSLDLTSSAGLRAGGDSGESAVAIERPEQSPLLEAVLRIEANYSAMPPKEAERLTEEQIGWLRDWIAAGAPWPSEHRQREIDELYQDKWSAEDGVAVATSGGLSPDWTNRRYKPEDLWAYQAVEKPAVDARGESPIDALIDAQMPAGLHPAPRANRTTLIGRASFDLTGLPPTPEQVARFVNDPLPERQAFAKLVDRLLASPHYGERMAQHWLDLVRYADSSGFANDYARGNAWRYRDYVVRSFNDDKPYDQFVGEQIAGDEINPGDPEMLIAAGFLRMGPWELTAMEVAKIARQRFLDDVTNSVGETFLAHSLQCARCHDHKFDPVPTRDYYSIQAVFATTQLAERRAAFLPEENTAGFAEAEYLKSREQEYRRALAELDEAMLQNAQQWLAQGNLPAGAWNAAVEKARRDSAKSNVFNATRDIMRKAQAPEDSYPPKLVGFTPEQFGMERVARKGLERLRWEKERYRPIALSVYNGRTPQRSSVTAPSRVPTNRFEAGELEQTCILAGGDPFSPAEPVTPGVLSVLDGRTSPVAEVRTHQSAVDSKGESTADREPAPSNRPNDENIEGRRRDLADWIADADNPLTTRAIVNRVWQWHFGAGLAGNPNNFGATGKRPTHPALLDWLAATLVEQGWSLKAVHRCIMNTQTYCRSSLHPKPEALAELDPVGVSYAVFRPRRLTGEEIRDAMLVATGELNPTVGGIPCRPEINQEVALQPRQVMGTFAAAWTPNPLPAQRHRRSLYVLKLRGLAYPLLEVFNAPPPDFSCERREASTVTPQALALFNSQASHDRALALADRAVRETTDDRAAVVRCFQLAFARSPEDDELQACLAHWRQIEASLPDVSPPSARPPLTVRRDAIEENTGERFTFEERLFSNEEYQPDLQPSDVTRDVRALADICLVLMNSNEFVYVY